VRDACGCGGRGWTAGGAPALNALAGCKLPCAYGERRDCRMVPRAGFVYVGFFAAPVLPCLSILFPWDLFICSPTSPPYMTLSLPAHVTMALKLSLLHLLLNSLPPVLPATTTYPSCWQWKDRLGLERAAGTTATFAANRTFWLLKLYMRG